ncbi:hypothetical protein JZ751_029397 [Albula glossodonta]|uniref:Ecto-NOX disulfide-thiol exchanger 1/2 domain-containing protein n=1 Tax=Albula glossodonta TaxID=121402 RepID=A0A8T2PHY4_9TELE|nr:hypothetical protein JZ751_029397 [Albula glossodonta]
MNFTNNRKLATRSRSNRFFSKVVIPLSSTICLLSAADDSKFPEAVRVLLTWVERGEVNRRNANNFYSMIQSSNSHIRRLMNEKAAHEKEMEEAKEKFKNALAGILVQFEQIVSVFHASSKQKAWDHFSKAQRKNLDMWRKQAEEIRNIHNEELMGIRREEEMEMSDDDMEDAPDSKDSDDSGPLAQAESLREENDSLRCQLDAYRNEVELLKQEQGKAQPQRSEEDATRQQQLNFLQQALQGMQKAMVKEDASPAAPPSSCLARDNERTLSGPHQLLKMREELKQKEVELEKTGEEKLQLESQMQSLKERALTFPLSQTSPLEPSEKDDRGSEDSANQANEAAASAVVSCSQEKENVPEKGPPSPVKSEREALLVGIISTFLHVHPFGASIEYICSYLQRLDTKISTLEVEALLGRLPCTFRQELTGVGASLEKRPPRDCGCRAGTSAGAGGWGWGRGKGRRGYRQGSFWKTPASILNLSLPSPRGLAQVRERPPVVRYEWESLSHSRAFSPGHSGSVQPEIGYMGPDS